MRRIVLKVFVSLCIDKLRIESQLFQVKGNENKVRNYIVISIFCVRLSTDSLCSYIDFYVTKRRLRVMKASIISYVITISNIYSLSCIWILSDVTNFVDGRIEDKRKTNCVDNFYFNKNDCDDSMNGVNSY